MNEIPNITERASQSWNMGNSAFKDLGTISTTTTYRWFDAHHGFRAHNERHFFQRTVNGTEFKYALSLISLGGRGTTSYYRSVSLRASASSALKITAKSSGSDTRFLAIVNTQGQTLERITCTSETSLGTITFSGDQTVYIYSE